MLQLGCSCFPYPPFRSSPSAHRVYSTLHMASSMWAPTLILTSLPSVALGFIVPGHLSTQRTACSHDDVRPSSTSIAAVATCPHVATPATNQVAPSLATQHRSGKRTSLYMSAAAAVEGGTSMAAEEGQRWAEERFPGCSTIVSTVRAAV